MNRRLLTSVLFCFLGFSLNLCFGQQAKLMLPVGHTVAISYAQFSPDDKTIITASLDNTAKIWDVETGKLLHTLEGHSEGVYHAQFNPDGKTVLTESLDKTAKIWSVQTGKLMFTLGGHSSSFWATFRMSPDGKTIISREQQSGGSLSKIWDAKNGLLVQVVHGVEVNYSPDSKYIFGFDIQDSSLILWNAKDLKVLHKEKHAFKYFFSPDSKRAGIVFDSCVKIYNLNTAELQFTISNNAPKAVIYSPDSKNIATLSKQGNIELWDTMGRLKRNFNTSQSIIYNFSFTPDSKKIIASSNDGLSKIWDISSGALIKTLHIGKRSFDDLEFSADGLYFACSGPDKDWDPNDLYYRYTQIWDSRNFTILKKLNESRVSTNGVHFSNDGKKLIIFYEDGNSDIREAKTGKLITKLKGYVDATNHILYSETGDTIFTISEKNRVYAWDNKTTKLLTEFNISASEYSIETIFTLNNEPVGLLYKDSLIKLLDFKTTRFVKELNAKFQLEFVKISRDNKHIIAKGGNNEVKVWETNKFALVFSDTLSFYPATGFISMNNNDIYFIPGIINDSQGEILKYNLIQKEFSFKKDILKNAMTTTVPSIDSNGIYNKNFTFLKNSFALGPNNQIFLQSQDQSGYIFNMETGKPLMILKLPDEKINFSCFNEQGTRLCTSSNEFLQIWDTQTGKRLLLLSGSNNIKEAVFSKDNNYLLTTSSDYQIKKWDLNNGNLVYSYFAVDKNDYLIVDPFNHYNGTNSAKKLLYFTCDNEIIELDQVKDQLWVPNLAERLNNGEAINAKTLAELNICGLTPVVEDISSKTDEHHFIILPRRGGLGETVFYLNGIEVKRYKTAELKKNAGKYELKIKKAALKDLFTTGKENLITVKAYTSDNTISSRGITVTVKADSISAIRPNLYAVMIGVSDYKGDELDLKYASKDATDISAVISNAAKNLLNTDGAQHVFIYNLTDESNHYQLPEKKGVKKLLEEIGKKATANDILLIFFAGHGVMQGKSDNKQFYFLTADASQASAASLASEVGISTAELTEWIKPANVKAQKRILIFDACNSGQAIRDFVIVGNKDQGYVSARSDEKGQEIKAIDKLNEKSGLFILSASASNQDAYEMGRYSQGLLTYSLLKAIKQKPDILNEGKYLDVSRWFNAAKEYVSDLAKEGGARQEPQIVSNTNFNIGIVDEEVISKIILPMEKPLFASCNFQNGDENILADDLGLNKLIDLQLNEIAARGMEASIVFASGSNSPDAFTLSGRYIITDSTISIKVFIRQNNVVKNKIDLTGTKDKLKEFAALIASQTADWANKNK